MEKVIRDGKVAVLVSRGYGAGWSTWGPSRHREIYLFHPKLVQMVEEKREGEITPEWIRQELDIDCTYVFKSGTDGLHIEWVPVGTQFYIDENDGFETLITFDNMNWITA